MNKNAYEIRLEVLAIAHNDAMDKYHHKLDSLRDYQTGKLSDPTVVESLFPKTEDIKKRAEELYNFVCNA